MVAAVSAIALFIFSFLPWFGVSADVVLQGGSENFNLWEAESTLDIYLLITILVALVPAALVLLGGGEDAFPLAPVATALLGAVGTLLIFYQLFDHDFFDVSFSVKVGFFLGLIASAGITVGGYLSMQEDMGRERY